MWRDFFALMGAGATRFGPLTWRLARATARIVSYHLLGWNRFGSLYNRRTRSDVAAGSG